MKIAKNVISRKLQGFEQSYLEARFVTPYSIPTGPNYRVGNFRFLKTNNNLSFQKNFEKNHKKRHISKTTLEQSNLDASFATFEITLTVPKYRVGNFRFCEKKLIEVFWKFFEKITKNVISRKLQRIEQWYLEARFAILESTLTRPNYRVGNFRFLKNRINSSFLKNFEKIAKNVISRKLQRLEQWYLEARFAVLERTLTGPNYRVGNFRFLNRNNSSFLKNFEKIAKNVISQKLQKIEQSYLEARFAIF